MCSIILKVLFSIIISLVTTAYAGQDPMRPPNWNEQKKASASNNKSIDLQQILISKNRKFIIINDEILREGQTVSGYEIIKIDAAEITIRRAGVSKVIRLLPTTKGENREI